MSSVKEKMKVDSALVEKMKGILMDQGWPKLRSWMRYNSERINKDRICDQDRGNLLRDKREVLRHRKMHYFQECDKKKKDQEKSKEEGIRMKEESE